MTSQRAQDVGHPVTVRHRMEVVNTPLIGARQQAARRLTDGVFPALRRKSIESLQVNLGYRCNQSCSHCHVAAGPNRRETMPSDVVEDVIHFLRKHAIRTLDLTGGAPELHPSFCSLITRAVSLGVEVIDRCNLTVLHEPGQEYLADFLAAHKVRIVASLPCYEEDTVDKQRGTGTLRKSIRALRILNRFGYGQQGTGLFIDLVYNPPGPSLAPPQQELERVYKAELLTRYGVTFNRLFAMANMPIGRFARALTSAGQMQAYLELLRASYRDANLEGTMCRRMLSIDWQGYAYDCDFNQMLRLPITAKGGVRCHIRELPYAKVEHAEIRVATHCFGCSAGQGSGCAGALLKPGTPNPHLTSHIPAFAQDPTTPKESQ